MYNGVVPKSYDQYCPVAEALDVVGERWTLLIIRELLMGPHRFTDLRIALPGVPPNLLSSRLRELEEEGLVSRRELPPPAARTVYELTEDGRGLEPTVRALARWGMRRLPPPGEGTVSPATAVRVALVGYARPKVALVPQRTWAIHAGSEAFTLELSAGRVWFRAGEAAQPDLVVVADPSDLIRMRRGDQRQRRVSALRYEPEDQELVDEFRAVFNLAGETQAEGRGPHEAASSR